MKGDGLGWDAHSDHFTSFKDVNDIGRVSHYNPAKVAPEDGPFTISLSGEEYY